MEGAAVAPLVRGAAVWALSKLAGDAAFATRKAERLLLENDATVREEWNGA